MVSITQETKAYIVDLAKKYQIEIDWDTNIDSKFQEQVSLKDRRMLIKENIEPTDFDYLFTQHGSDYPVDRDQEMFLFNALHGIGHFELNLWKPDTGDPIVDRLINFDHDKEIDKWAYDRLVEIRGVRL